MKKAGTSLKQTVAALLFGALGFAAMAAAVPTTVMDVGSSAGYPEFENLSLHSDGILVTSGMASAGNEPWCSSWDCYLDGECGMGCTCVRMTYGAGYCTKWW